MRVPPSQDAPQTWQDGRCDCRTRAEHDAVCFTRTREAFRAAFDDDADRIERRVHAAMAVPWKERAVVDVVLDERADVLRKVIGGADDELARRLEWATGRNGVTLLAQIRAEGLDVMTVTKEQAP